MLTKMSFGAWMTDCGYELVQCRGQRIFRPISPEWETDEQYDRVKNLEVFIKNLPVDLLEDELIPFLNRVGPVYQTRLLVNFSKYTRGMAYVTFAHEDCAFRAVIELNQQRIRRDSGPVTVDFSVNNRRLMITNFDPALTEGQLHTELEVHFPGDIKRVNFKRFDTESPLIDLTPTLHAVVTFYTHKAAASARRAFLPGLIQVRGSVVQADWAKPQDSQSLFVSLTTTHCVQQEDLLPYFQLTGTEVTRVAIHHKCVFIKYKTLAQAYRVMVAYRKLILPFDIGNGVQIRKVSWPDRS